jgi:hypothetical protein
MVDPMFGSWNRITDWLSRIEALCIDSIVEKEQSCGAM